MQVPSNSKLMSRDEARWAAVVTNDRAADGRFVYAVLTTGVYCRPSCSSRRPARQSVSFYDTAAEAERAGYRACRKCGGRPAAADDPELLAVRRACQAIEDCDEQAPSLQALADAVAMPPHRLHRLFRKITGITPRQYWDSIRQSRLRTNLKSGEAVAPALYGAGYGSASRLYEQSNRQLGMTPASYGRGGAGTVIAFSLRAAPPGLVLVAATPKGVCFVALGETEDSLADDLRAEFPQAELRRDDHGLGGMLDAVIRHLAGALPDIRLPLDIRATAFQRQVWQALTDIPYGETRSYGELAAALGRPGAARAVGQACQGNPVALLVPCHRVVGADGRMTGYRWGIERKRRLLAGEREAVASGAAGDG